MNELEQQLLQTFKNFVAQYEQDKQQQAEQINGLVRQVNNLSDSVTKLNNKVDSLTNRVEKLTKSYQDITNVLEE